MDILPYPLRGDVSDRGFFKTGVIVAHDEKNPGISVLEVLAQADQLFQKIFIDKISWGDMNGRRWVIWRR